MKVVDAPTPASREARSPCAPLAVGRKIDTVIKLARMTHRGPKRQQDLGGMDGGWVDSIIPSCRPSFAEVSAACANPCSSTPARGMPHKTGRPDRNRHLKAPTPLPAACSFLPIFFCRFAAMRGELVKPDLAGGFISRFARVGPTAYGRSYRTCPCRGDAATVDKAEERRAQYLRRACNRRRPLFAEGTAVVLQVLSTDSRTARRSCRRPGPFRYCSVDSARRRRAAASDAEEKDEGAGGAHRA